MERLGDTWLYESGVQEETPAGDRHLRSFELKGYLKPWNRVNLFSNRTSKEKRRGRRTDSWGKRTARKLEGKTENCSRRSQMLLRSQVK